MRNDLWGSPEDCRVFNTDKIKEKYTGNFRRAPWWDLMILRYGSEIPQGKLQEYTSLKLLHRITPLVLIQLYFVFVPFIGVLIMTYLRSFETTSRYFLIG